MKSLSLKLRDFEFYDEDYKERRFPGIALVCNIWCVICLGLTVIAIIGLLVLCYFALLITVSQTDVEQKIDSVVTNEYVISSNSYLDEYDDCYYLSIGNKYKCYLEKEKIYSSYKWILVIFLILFLLIIIDSCMNKLVYFSVYGVLFYSFVIILHLINPIVMCLGAVVDFFVELVQAVADFFCGIITKQ